MMRQNFYFVAGEQVMTKAAANVLDAFLAIHNKARKTPIANEFRTLAIEAYDEAGVLLGKRTWQQWHEAVLRDIYGEGWQEKLEHAQALSR
jgi:hypothetical protein